MLQNLATDPAGSSWFADDCDNDEMAHRRAQMRLVGTISNRLDEDRFVLYLEDVDANGALPREAVRFMTRLTAAALLLDDFGAGMASFSNLKNFSVNYLKIDGSFVRAMQASRADSGMVEPINRYGHEMGLKTIAEFVETVEFLAAMREMGVDYVQGCAIVCGRPFEELFAGCQ